MSNDAETTNASLLAGLLASQQILVLQRRADGTFALAGLAPDWFARILPEDYSPEAPFDPAAAFPYLEVFLPEAEALWSGTASAQLRSGWWTQSAHDGEVFQLEATALRLPQGGCLLVRRLEEDYEERQGLLQKARELLLHREQMVRETGKKEILLHCIVHDLNGPLSALLAALEVLALESLSDPGRNCLEHGRAAARRQSIMIRDLLDVFAAEVRALDHFHTDPATAPDAHACAREALEVLKPAFTIKGVAPDLRLAPGLSQPCLVTGERSKLERIFFNLLENALRHTPAGRAVTVELSEQDGFIRAAVLDEGPGLAPEMAGRVFQKFVKHSTGGKAGLGLYFCRLMVEQWGGSIGCEARPEGGACFWFRLPRPKGIDAP